MGGIGSWISDRLGLNPPKVTPPVLDSTKLKTNQDIADWASRAFNEWRQTGTATPGAMKFQPISRGMSTVNGMTGYDPGRMSLAYQAATAGMDQAKADAVEKSREFYGSRGLLRSTAGMQKEGEIRADYDTRKMQARNQLELADLAEGERQRQTDIERAEGFGDKQYARFFDMLNAARVAAGGDPYTPQSMINYQTSLAKRNAWTSPLDNLTKVAGAFGYGL